MDKEYDDFVVLYVDLGENYFPIHLKDFRRFWNKLFTTNALVAKSEIQGHIYLLWVQ